MVIGILGIFITVILTLLVRARRILLRNPAARGREGIALAKTAFGNPRIPAIFGYFRGTGSVSGGKFACASEDVPG